MAKYKLLVCGGTFDLLHKGHKTFIKQILDISDKVLLGLTSDLYVQSFKNENEIESFEVRRKTVEQFLDSIGVKTRVEIVSINNAYEPYLETSIQYQAIAVTPQTQHSALDINAKRKKNSVPELEIVIIPMELAEDENVISSTRIRNGEINRDGRLYINPKWKNKNLTLPENLRSELQKPWGEVLNKIPQNINSLKTVVVGDATAQKFNEKKIGQLLSIVDFLIHREIKFHQLSEIGFDAQGVQKIINPPGRITPELFEAVIKAFDAQDTKRKIILIEGEDDLAVLPTLLIAPLGFSVFYGQFGKGLVRIDVTEENKEKAYELAEKFVSKKELS